MIATPYAAGMMWAIALAWPSESHGHTISDPMRFHSLDACTQALPKVEAIVRENKSRGIPICVEVRQ